FEGGEACGKSTQAARLAARRGAVLTREPGGTALGERVRGIFLDPASGHIDGRAEALLVAAARAQHVAEVIEPALAAGGDVVTDRFTGSSLAYQGHGRGLPIEEVRRLSAFASGGLEPDVYVLLEVPADVAAVRLGDERDRMESAGDDFHDRVRRGYTELARTEGWVVVDGTGTPDEVEAAVWAAVAGRLGW
ncbi:MAG: thymidylate kinase, partial [Actinomycetia bacterium]|nr:thymidylate kinase [Actinomycetes bacterium]